VTGLRVEAVRLTPASAADQAIGLLGFVRATIGGLVVDRIALRRSLTGALVLTFPDRADRTGRRHAVVRPADDAVRQALTREILGALALDAAATARPDAQEESGP
jgi:hypothetical protein